MSAQWGSGNGSATASSARSVGEVLESERRLAAEVEALRAQVQAVRELHRPCADPDLHDGAHCCPECSDFGRSSIFRPWPCPTARALGGGA